MNCFWYLVEIFRARRVLTLLEDRRGARAPPLLKKANAKCIRKKTFLNLSEDCPRDGDVYLHKGVVDLCLRKDYL